MKIKVNNLVKSMRGKYNILMQRKSKGFAYWLEIGIIALILLAVVAVAKTGFTPGDIVAAISGAMTSLITKVTTLFNN